MAVENINEVVEFIEQNKESDEVKAFMEQYTPKAEITPEGVQTFLATDTGKKLLQPELDRYATKAIDSWKSNNLQRIIDDEMVKRQVVETPEQKSIREMQERIHKIEKEKQRETLKNVALMEFSRRGLPDALTDYMIGDSEEGTRRNIQMLEMEWKASLERAVEDRLRSNGSVPSIKPAGAEQTHSKDVGSMSYAEMQKLYAENPQAFNSMLGGIL